MRVVFGDLWTYPAHYRVITTNGAVRQNGGAVMGRGCALEAKTRYPGIEYRIGSTIRGFGNHCHYITFGPTKLFTFPVKHHWREPADLELIKRSATELVALIDSFYMSNDSTIVLPRPGCGNGQLLWEQVEPVLSPLLDDRFHVITK